MNKYCSSCKENKNVSCFGNKKRAPDGLQWNCKECVSNQTKAQRQKRLKTDYKKQRDLEKKANLKRTFGIDLETYNKMCYQQNSVCAICHKPEQGKSLAVDHCHATGKIRALLCMHCNHMLGKAQDNPDRLRAAALYLERFMND